MLTPYFLWLPLLLKLVVLDVPKALVPMNKLLLMDGFVMVVEDVGKIKPVMNRHLVLVDLVAFMVVDGVAKTGLNKNPLMISLDQAFVLDLDAERVASLLMKNAVEGQTPAHGCQIPAHGFRHGGRGGWKNQTGDEQTPAGPGFFRGRGCWKANPQMQELHKEISGLRDIVQAKRVVLHNAKLNGAPQSEVEALFEDFVVARNNLRAKKLAKGELKDSMIKARLLECNAERKCEDPAVTEEPVCQKKKGWQQNPELAAIQNEIVGLRQIVWTKREALAQARRSGAPKEQIEPLFEAFVTARTNLREKKVAKRNLKAGACLKSQTI